ncbi:uncharacterized protein ACIB01_013542 [Guaruba guarouba]
MTAYAYVTVHFYRAYTPRQQPRVRGGSKEAAPSAAPRRGRPGSPRHRRRAPSSPADRRDEPRARGRAAGTARSHGCGNRAVPRGGCRCPLGDGSGTEPNKPVHLQSIFLLGFGSATSVRPQDQHTH